MNLIVDSHAHLLPDRLAAAVRSFFEEHITDQLAYPPSPTEVVASHVEAGVGVIWNLPYAHRAGIADQLNRDVALLCAGLSTSGFSLIPGCTIHPGDSRPAWILQRAVEEYGSRVLKLHCSVGGYLPDDPRLDPIWSTAGSLGVPVVLHAGLEIDGTTANEDLQPLETVLAKHPDVTVILAHLGSPASRAAMRLMIEHPNLYGDLTPVLGDHVDVSAHELLDAVKDRLLFGSDAPNTGFKAESLIGWVRGLFPDLSHQRRVLGGTALTLVPLD